MTDARRGPGYPGALPPRDDRLARIWVAVVVALFVLIFVLSVLGVPSRLLPEATAVPVPSIPAPSLSDAASPSDEVSPSEEPSAS